MRLEEICDKLETRVMELEYQLELIRDVLEGKEVSEFALSFPEVNAVQLIKMQRDLLLEENK